MSDGQWRTLDARGLYRQAKAAGVEYQTHLRAGLRASLGVEFGDVDTKGQVPPGQPRVSAMTTSASIADAAGPYPRIKVPPRPQPGHVTSTTISSSAASDAPSKRCTRETPNSRTGDEQPHSRQRTASADVTSKLPPKPESRASSKTSISVVAPRAKPALSGPSATVIRSILPDRRPRSPPTNRITRPAQHPRPDRICHHPHLNDPPQHRGLFLLDHQPSVGLGVLHTTSEHGARRKRCREFRFSEYETMDLAVEEVRAVRRSRRAR